MKGLKRVYFFVLSPLVMVAALILFILDTFNVNVASISSYTLKEINYR